jgi:Cu+-exporting ATPase
VAKDPACGVDINEEKAKFKSEYMSKTYYFCCEICKTTFDRNPAKYTGGHMMHSKQC